VFKNVRQQGTVCAVLTQRLPQSGGPYWSAKGDPEFVPRPTQRARAALKSGMSHGEKLLLRATWAVWNSGIPNAKVDFGAMLDTLDNRNLAMIGNLLVALSAPGSSAIDAWIRQYDETGESLTSVLHDELD